MQSSFQGIQSITVTTTFTVEGHCAIHTSDKLYFSRAPVQGTVPALYSDLGWSCQTMFPLLKKADKVGWLEYVCGLKIFHRDGAVVKVLASRQCDLGLYLVSVEWSDKEHWCSSLDGMVVYHRVPPSIVLPNGSFVPICTAAWGRQGGVKLFFCLRNNMMHSETRTRTTDPSKLPIENVQHANNYGIIPPTIQHRCSFQPVSA